MNPQVLKELADVISEPLTIPFEKSWRLGEVLDDRKRTNIVFIFKKRKRRIQGIKDQSV